MTAGAERPRLTDDGGGTDAPDSQFWQDHANDMREDPEYRKAFEAQAAELERLTTCPTCGTPGYNPLADAPPQPGASDPRHRAALIAGVRAVVDSNRRQRETVNSEESTDE